MDVFQQNFIYKNGWLARFADPCSKQFYKVGKKGIITHF